MDIELARTFLAIVETGSFVEAARRVHVTQSTVSMRVKTLEDQLGKPLFQRGKSGAALTPAGRRFHRHALALVRVWQQARLDAALPEGAEAMLSIGAQVSLWEGFLIDGLALLRKEAPEFAIRTEVGFSDTLTNGLIDGALDIAVVYAPEMRAGFGVERLFDEELVLVSSDPEVVALSGDEPPDSYVYVDWGPEFRAEQATLFPGRRTPLVQLRIGSIGLSYLFAAPACGYFPQRLVAGPLRRGALRRVEGAPRFLCPAFAVFPVETASTGALKALDCMRAVAARIAATEGGSGDEAAGSRRATSFEAILEGGA